MINVIKTFFFSCQECVDDTDCLSDQYCLGLSKPTGHLLLQCMDRRPLGSECDRNDMCEEGNCQNSLCQKP